MESKSIQEMNSMPVPEKRLFSSFKKIREGLEKAAKKLKNSKSHTQISIV